MKKTQVIVSNQHDPYLNLAVETWLTDHQDRGMVTMYLWKNEQTVVIGLNQNPFAECDVKRLNEEGGHLMRRRTGGGAVYHDLGNLNFSFIADKNDYNVRKQQSVIQEALKPFGLEAEISGRNDLTCQGRKFSGNAFFNGPDNNLHHGTILIKTDGEKMQRYLTVNQAKLQKHGVKSVASRVVNLSELADITSENIVEPLIQSFEKVYGMKAEHLHFESIALLDEIQNTVRRISSHDYLYGKWEHFHTTKRQQFPWGNVDIQLEVDESHGIIRNARIASDCLDTDIISKTETLLKGQSTKERPSCDHPITNDILNLLYP
ncbi:MAG: lipoate--protein ligase [Bacteroidales bacterium]|nr:lipoate--protein ligase [Bacteroidales bacterium]